MHAANTLKSFVAQLLELEGAEVATVEPDGLEYLAPLPLQQTLKTGEFGRLGFGVELPDGAQRVSFESDWIERLGHVLGDRGRVSRSILRPPITPISNPERVLDHALTLQNAVYRLTGVSPAWTRYLILTFHYSAFSDEKRDGIVPLVLNLSNGSTPDEFAGPLVAAANADRDPSDSLRANVDLPPLWDSARLGNAVRRALPPRVRQSVAAFLAGLQRRLERGLGRVFEYHNDLREESLRRLQEQTSDIGRERLRVEAITREYQAKVADLQQKYAVRIALEWIQTQELIIPVQRFGLLVKRRKGERRLHLDWNPIAKRIEPPPCEFTFAADSLRVVCDEALHLVSPAAHKACAQCGKEYCRACHPLKCPKCGRRQENVVE
jgi:hypothetical protein